MTQIVLEGGIVERLLELNGPVRVCDPSGRVLGEFHPCGDGLGKLPAGFESPFSKEELDAARSDPGRYTTDEVLRHLKSL